MGLLRSRRETLYSSRRSLSGHRSRKLPIIFIVLSSVKFAPNLFTSSCVFCSDPVPGASSRLTWATARVSWRSPGVHSRHTEAVSVQKPAFGDADHILLLSCVTYSRLPPPRSTVRVKPKRAGTTHTPYSAVPLVAVGPRRRCTLGTPSSRLSPEMCLPAFFPRGRAMQRSVPGPSFGAQWPSVTALSKWACLWHSD